MTTAVIIDTLQIAKRAKEAGFTEQQAKFYAESLAEIANNQTLRNEIKESEAKIKLKISETKTDIFKWLLVIVIGMIAMIAIVLF